MKAAVDRTAESMIDYGIEVHRRLRGIEIMIGIETTGRKEEEVHPLIGKKNIANGLTVTTSTLERTAGIDKEIIEHRNLVSSLMRQENARLDETVNMHMRKRILETIE